MILLSVSATGKLYKFTQTDAQAPQQEAPSLGRTAEFATDRSRRTSIGRQRHTYTVRAARPRGSSVCDSIRDSPAMSVLATALGNCEHGTFG